MTEQESREATLAVSGPVAEVVAWRWVHKKTGTVQLRERPLDDLPFNRANWTCDPLVLSSPQPAPDAEGVRDNG